MVLPLGIRLLSVGVMLLGSSACGSSQDLPVQDTAEEFYAAVARHDGRAACRLLAPETLSQVEESAQATCAEAVLQELRPEVRDPEQVKVFGTMAQVGYDGETVFLTRFRDGWKVMAAGCSPEAAERYDCQVEGG
jgi:hypothetical protein